ncbi:MAG: ATP-binding protein [Acidobacteriota bacterium]
MNEVNKSRQKANILLVDDQPNNLLALEAMLGDLGENLVRAQSGVQALRKLLDQEFAVILLDVQMPELDGFETATLIRERDRSRHTPIIFVTALSRSETNVFKGYSLGAVDYLFKPIVPEILRSKVAVFVDLFRKNEEVRNKAADLARLSRQNELILNSAADGLVGSNLDSESTFANISAANMLGRSVESMIGEDVHELLHPSIAGRYRCDESRCPVRAALEGEQTADIRDDVFWRIDGSSFPVEYSATAMRSDDQRLLGTVLTFRDVTERRAAAMARENERLYREAQQANQAKDDFLATLSHELRTPMTAILGWLEILSFEDTDAETMVEGLATIRNSARAQAQLIDDMLDVSRIIMGKFRVEPKPEDLEAIVTAGIEAIRPAADEKNLRIEYKAHGKHPRAFADARRFGQVVWNLLSNSIKFTEPGGVITVDLSSDENTVQFSVHDTGQGISAEFLPFVFDRLNQAEAAKSSGGLGLGLAIARHIVELHGGTIEAFSEGEQEGARFTVSLPVWSDETENAPVISGALG